MILRKANQCVILILFLTTIRIYAQNARSYDTNDWIPIDPKNNQNPEETKKPTGRVLNLDRPNQKFFPDDDYTRKRPQIPQYLRETVFAKPAPNQQSYRIQQNQQEPYKFENINQNQYQPIKNENKQFFTTQSIPQSYSQTPQLTPPPANQNPNQFNYNIPFNTSFYQSLNPGSINQELLGAIQNIDQIPPPTPAPSKIQQENNKETVQLLYVPLENLKPLPQQSQTVLKQTEFPANLNQQISSRTQAIPPDNHKQFQLENIQNDFIRQALEAHRLQQQLHRGHDVLLEATSSTLKPRKRKPHQPPLAVYMGKNGPTDVNDVLNALKNAKTISVQDTVGPDSPQVFVGPSNLSPPEGYSKFPLPYLSSIETNRIERKVDQLPFFVAPLSYKTPKGYSKIPLPSPHVGSVVVSNKDEVASIKPPSTTQNQIGQYEEQFSIPHKNQLRTQYAQDNLNLFPIPNLGVTSHQNLGVTQNAFTSFEVTPKNLVQSQLNNYNLNGLPQRDQINQYNFNPVETIQQTSNYQDNAKTQLLQTNQYQPPIKQSYTIPQTNPLLYNNYEEPVRQPTTEFTPSTNQFKFDNIFDRFNFKELSTKNQQPEVLKQEGSFDKDQTNNQFEQENRQYLQESTQAPLHTEIVTNTPSVTLNQNYINNFDIISTTTPHTVRARKRQRLRPTQATLPPTRSSFESDNDKYTVLEEFSLKTKPTPTQKYTTEVETIPANVYKINTEQLEPVYIQNQQNQQTQQHILNQQMLDQQILHSNFEQSSPTKQDQQQTENASQNPRYEYSPDSYQISQGESYSVPQINSFLPGLINNLQDQSIKSLLVPKLLVPTTEKLTTSTFSLLPNPDPTPITSTEIIPEITSKFVLPSTETPYVETTTQRRTRGRQRGNSNRYSSTTTRRSVNRRRPAHSRTTTERHNSISTTEYSPIRLDNPRANSGHASRQRFRTRGRPVNENTITERMSHNTPDPTKFVQPEYENGFQGSFSNKEPQSYMQFEHTIQDQQLITVKPDVSSSEETQSDKIIKDYQHVYNFPTQESSTTPNPNKQQVVDIQITHPSIEPNSNEGVLLTKPTQQTQYINVQSGGVLYNNKPDEETTTIRPVRVRGRTRNRSRLSSTTVRPPTTWTTSTTKKPVETRQGIENEDEEEFYGFIRTPNFNKPPSTERTPQIYSSTYQTSAKPISIELIDNLSSAQTDQSKPVHFIGEIRPKYHPTTTTTTSTTTEYKIEAETEAPKFRTRGRMRVPSRKTQSYSNQASNEIASTKSEETTRRPLVRGRTRGQSHFKLPESLIKEKSEDDDIEGGNYPTSYLNHKESLSTSTTTPAPTSVTGFQITIDPYDEEENKEDDQTPYSSINIPKILPHPSFDNFNNQWTGLASGNQIQIEDKKIIVDSLERDQPLALGVVSEVGKKDNEEEIEDSSTTTEATIETTTTKKKGRRRGVWKLVKQRPVDHLETAESQNYQTVLNTFREIYKVSAPDAPKSITTTTAIPPTVLTTTTTEKNIFDSFYSMFGISQNENNSESEINANYDGESDSTEENFTATPFPDIEKIREVTTTTLSPTFPEKFTEQSTTQIAINSTTINKDENVMTSSPSHIETTPSTLKKIDPEPWEMHAVKTSTSMSTEISHETEICYKGRCVKSSMDKKAT